MLSQDLFVETLDIASGRGAGGGDLVNAQAQPRTVTVRPPLRWPVRRNTYTVPACGTLPVTMQMTIASPHLWTANDPLPVYADRHGDGWGLYRPRNSGYGPWRWRVPGAGQRGGGVSHRYAPLGQLL